MLQEDKSSLHHHHHNLQPQPALPQLHLHLQSHLQPTDQKPQPQLLSSASEKHGDQKPTDFIMKIFTFLNSEQTDKNLVRWSDSGDSFLIFDSSAFAKTMLPVHFKHGNFSSFVRQLNKYGFRKRGRKMNDVSMSERGDNNSSTGASASIDQSASSSNNTISTSTTTTAAAVPECEFYHELFKRGREDLLPDLKRKRKVDNDSKSSSLLKDSSTSNDFMDSDDINLSTENFDALKFYKFQQETIQTIQVLSSRVKELTREVAVLKDQMARMSSVSAASSTAPVNTAAPSMHGGPMIPPGVHHVPFISAPVFPTMQFGGFPSSSDDIQWIRKPKILLVDDDETIRQLGSRILQVFHCGCELASSGSEAIQMFNSTRISGGKYDLILMDIMMPGIDGIET